MKASTLQMEMGTLMGLAAAVLLGAAIGGVHGKFIAALLVLPMVWFFKWLCAPLVHILVPDDPQWIKDTGTDLKMEHRAANQKAVHAHVEGEEWVCICGTRNPFYPRMRIQNCSQCFRSRDFVLKNYGE